MSMTGVLRPGHVQIRVLDMAEALAHYVDAIGLSETDRDDQGRVYLKAWDEYDAFSVVLRETDEAGMDFVSYKVDSVATLDQLEKDVQAFGLETQRIPAGDLNRCGERVRFVLPTGHNFELFAEKEKLGRTGLSDINPEAWPEDARGMRARRFDHCLLYGDDIEGVEKLLTQVLGFHLTEQAFAEDNETQVAVFYSCSNKAHDIAFVRHPEKNKFHHASFLLETWEDILRAADIMSMKEIPIDIGPTRHGITAGRTIYFFDPSGNRNEVFCEVSNWYPDYPVKSWTGDQLGKAIFYHDRTLNERFLGVVT